MSSSALVGYRQTEHGSLSTSLPAFSCMCAKRCHAGPKNTLPVMRYAHFLILKYILYTYPRAATPADCRETAIWSPGYSKHKNQTSCFVEMERTVSTLGMVPDDYVGPYVLQELVELELDVQGKQNIEITCLESLEDNLYVGTSSHEIVHFFSIPPTPSPLSQGPPKPTYILASRHLITSSSTNTSAASYIKQILLIPSVSRALVLSSTGLLSFYTLPEFAPAFDGQTLAQVSYIGGLDLNEEEEEARLAAAGEELEGDKRGKLVMVLAKKKIRMIRIGEKVLLVKDIELPLSMMVARREHIACLATSENYALVDVDNIRRIPLFPITSSSGETSTIEEEPSSPTSSTSRARSPTPTPSHPPKASSSQYLPRTTTRARRSSSAGSSKEAATTVHNRSVSTGNISRGAGKADKGGGSSRGGSQAARSARPPSRQSALLLSPPQAESPRSGSPSSPTSLSPAQIPIPPSKTPSPTSSGAHSPASASPQKPSHMPAPQPPKLPAAPPAPPAKNVLKPHILSPTPDEFLLTTGTRPEDPGVGMFVDINGDVTPRGTISFTKYPEEILLQNGWVIAVIPGGMVEVVRWDLLGEEEEEEANRWGLIEVQKDGGKIGVMELTSLKGSSLGLVAEKLRLVKVRLQPGGNDAEEDENDRRNLEERVIAERISLEEGKVVVFNRKKIWRLVQSPLVLRWDSRLQFSAKILGSSEEALRHRIYRILKVLKEVDKHEPTTERSFHEVSFTRQKCGFLLLGEFLQMQSFQPSGIESQEIFMAEEALIEGGLDPRLVVAVFQNGFEEDIVEGEGGIWVYGGIKAVYNDLRSRTPVLGRETLLLLKRYLASWRGKEGFGSVASGKEVFRTVNAALLRVLLMLDTPELREQKGSTVIPEGNVRMELYTFIEPGVDDFDYTINLLEKFKRLYVISLLYQKRKMYREVLSTWRRILEGDDTTGELVDGEERVKNYLLRMKDSALVEEYGRWLAKRNPRLGVEVFADEKAKVQFEPSKVLDVLREFAPGAVRNYVEYLVIKKKNTEYATELILLFLDDLINTISTSTSASERLKVSYESYRALSSPKPTYREFLVDNSPPSDADGQEDWWRNRIRLLELLGAESGYSFSQVLTKVEKFSDVLVAEMIILYGREARHEDALRLLTHDLKDFDTAINYCLFGGLSIFQTRVVITDREEQNKLFAMLLMEFLKLEDLGERIEQTTMLLERFGGWLDVVHVLSVIPDSWSIDILSGFLISTLRQLVREKAEVGIIRGLRRGENLKVRITH
ncbi:hypothetical protein RUND412_002837 [Rhizina undulata]